MIEGDDLFQKGYALMTRSMPSAPIEQVELIQRYSNNRLMTEVENSSKVALNLKLADGAKTKPFGNVNLEGGIENKYSAQGSVITIGKKFKGYLSGGINNVGYSSLSDASNRAVQDDQENMSNDKVENLIGIATPVLPLNDSRYSSDKNKLALFSAMWKPIEPLKIHFWVHYNQSKSRMEENQTSIYVSDVLSFTNRENNIIKGNDNNSIYKLKLTYDISKRTILESTSQANINRNDTWQQILFNESPI